MELAGSTLGKTRVSALGHGQLVLLGALGPAQCVVHAGPAVLVVGALGQRHLLVPDQLLEVAIADRKLGRILPALVLQVALEV